MKRAGEEREKKTRIDGHVTAALDVIIDKGVSCSLDVPWQKYVILQLLFCVAFVPRDALHSNILFQLLASLSTFSLLTVWCC